MRHADCGLRGWNIAYTETRAAVVTREDGSSLIEVTMKPAKHEPFTLTLYQHQAAALISDLAAALAAGRD